jgi:hypothetical protein
MERTDIELSLVNKSQDANNSSVIIFQKNNIPEFDDTGVAWRVIRNLGRDTRYPFIFPMQLSISAVDSYGNYTSHVTVEPGMNYIVIEDNSGMLIKPDAATHSKFSETTVTNVLDKGTIEVHAFRDNKLISLKTNIAPGNRTTFSFNPKIYIGVVANVTEGEVIDSAIIKQINTEISLLGLKSADIIMTGGGQGPDATKFEFSLENVHRI